MDGPRRTALRLLILTVDAVLIFVAVGAAFGAHALLLGRVPYLREPPQLSAYIGVAYAALPLWLWLIAGLGLHRMFERRWTRFDLLLDLVRLHAFGFVGLGVVLFLTQAVLNRSIIALFLASSFALLYAERALILAWARHQQRTGRAITRLLVVGGPGPQLERFLQRAAAEELPPLVVGRLGPDVPVDGPPRLGALEDLPRVLSEEAVDEVVFFPPHHDPTSARDALDACVAVGVPASFALDTRPLGGLAPQVKRADEAAFLTYEISAKPAARLAIKHAFDALAAAFILIAVAPILVGAIAAVLVTMGRPVFFVQKRAGLRGREFAMLKLRTMVRDAEARKAELADRNEMSGPVFKVAADPRITPLGRFLRRTSIDELPQLLHVLSGAMSLVGPRPLPVAEQQKVSTWHRRRLSMKPGITCLWQVSGRSDIDFEDWMLLDLRYVDEWSLGLDLKILLRTIPAVLGGRGAR